MRGGEIDNRRREVGRLIIGGERWGEREKGWEVRRKRTRKIESGIGIKRREGRLIKVTGKIKKKR